MEEREGGGQKAEREEQREEQRSEERSRGEQKSRDEWEEHRAELRVENPAIIGHSGKRRMMIGDGACAG